MKIKLDVVIADCTMTFEELTKLQEGSIKLIDNFNQSEVFLKSGSETLAVGRLVNIDGQYGVSIDFVNDLAE